MESANVIFSSFMLVALSEMGDKTQILALSLSARYRKPWLILAGIFIATLINHALASSLGLWISTHLPKTSLSLILSISFILFGIYTLIEAPESSESTSRYHPFLATVVLFFLAEMGDKTQLATIALGAKYNSPFLVTTGTTLGILFSDGLAVFIGEKWIGRIPMRWIRWSAAFLFFALGLLAALKVLR